MFAFRTMVHRKLLSTILVMLVIVEPVSSQRPITGKTQIPNEINAMMKVEQVKFNILKGLNMTSPPNLGMWLSGKSKITSKTPRTLETVDRQPNVSTVHSESIDKSRQDTMSFRIDSRLRAQLQYMDSAVLILYLHVPNDTSGSVSPTAGHTKDTESQNASNVAASSQYLHQHNDMKVWNSDRTDTVSTNKLSGRLPPLHASNTTTNEGDNGIRRQGQRQPTNAARSQPMRALSRQSRVKVILKVVGQGTGRKQKIAEKQIIVKGSTTAAIPVPKDVVVAAAASMNHTLVLQVTCRRCRSQVQIEKVYKRFTKKNKKTGRRLNPNRPYLLIIFGNNKPGLDLVSSARGRQMGIPNEIVRRRSRRKVSQICSTTEGHNKVRTLSPSHVTCCSKTVLVSFEELDLNFIIYPKGFSTVVCLGSCSTVNDVTRWWRFESGRPHMPTLPLHDYVDSSMPPAQPSEPQVVRRKQVVDPDSVNKPRTPGRHCVPAASTPLSVVYLDGNNQPTFTRLNHVVHESCDCTINL